MRERVVAADCEPPRDRPRRPALLPPLRSGGRGSPWLPAPGARASWGLRLCPPPARREPRGHEGRTVLPSKDFPALLYTPRPVCDLVPTSLPIRTEAKWPRPTPQERRAREGDRGGRHLLPAAHGPRAGSTVLAPRPPRRPGPLTRDHVQVHGVAEAGLGRVARVVPAVIDAGREAVAGLGLGLQGAAVVEPAGGGAPGAGGPLAGQSHVVPLQHVDPRGLEAQRGLRETCGGRGAEGQGQITLERLNSKALRVACRPSRGRPAAASFPRRPWVLALGGARGIRTPRPAKVGKPSMPNPSRLPGGAHFPFAVTAATAARSDTAPARGSGRLTSFLVRRGWKRRARVRGGSRYPGDGDPAPPRPTPARFPSPPPEHSFLSSAVPVTQQGC